MKIPARPFFLAALASWLTLTVAVMAQDTSRAPADSATPPPAQVAPDAPAPAQPTSDPAAPTSASPSTPAPSAAPETPSAETTSEGAGEEPELRRLDQAPSEQAGDSEEAGSTEAAGAESDQIVEDESVEPAEEIASEAPAAAKSERDERREWRQQHRFNRQTGNARVAFWQDSSLAEGEQADAVVSIVGSSTSAGNVGDAVVSILGSSTSSGDVGQAVVSVFGSSRVTGGTVGDAVVSVLGNTYVNGKVYGDVVAVLGNVELGPDAAVHGEIVCVGGRVIRDAGAAVHGQVNNVAIGFNFGGFEWLHAWVSQCLLYGRPLAFGPNLMWAWWLAIGFLALYLALALLFPRGIERCAQTLEQRPGFSLLTAFLVTLLTPAAAVLLAITFVGTPALILCLVVAGLFGKAVMLAWIGRRITKWFGDGPLSHPFAAVAFGGVIVLLLYTVPIVGFVVAKLTSWLGVGVVVYTLILGMQRPKSAPVLVGSAAGVPPVVPNTPPPAAGFEASNVVSTPVAGAPLPEAPVVAQLAVPPVISAVTQPRAGFWIRLAASALDAALVAVAINLFPDRWEPNFLLAFAVYLIVLWGTKATTIGGIVCSLKVVRLDDRPVDWPTALVRTLGGFVSLIPAGLGFIWVAFDDQRQSWHDKIAGTTIVRVPRGVSLV